MFILNTNLRNRLGMNKLMAADSGANGGEGNDPTAEDEADNKSGDDKETNQEPEQKEKTFTQDEVNKLITKRLAKEKAKLEKEIGKQKFDEGMTEAEKLSKMTKEEKAAYELDKKMKDFEKKEKEFAAKELKQSAVGILSDKGFDAESCKQLSTILDYADADTCKKSIETIEAVIQSVVAAQIDKKIKTTTTPKTSVAGATDAAEVKLRKAMGLK